MRFSAWRWAVMVAFFIAGGAAWAHSSNQTVIVVRHAERATDDSSTDPGLSEAGKARVDALAAVLKAAGVRHIITSNLRRTSDTAAPLAKAAKLNPQVVPVERGRTPQHVEAVVEAVRLALRAAAVEPNAAVLVVGHSNTVPEIVKSLSGHDVGRQCEHQFAPLFIVTPARGSAPGRVVAARYGQPDSAPAPTPPGAEKPQCM